MRGRKPGNDLGRREKGRIVVVGFGRIDVEVSQNDDLRSRLV